MTGLIEDATKSSSQAVYTPPRVIRIGDINGGIGGANCSLPGSSAVDSCIPGGTASKVCNTGSDAGTDCSNGTLADGGAICTAGGGGNSCTLGSTP